jgi:hypothetical protein
MVTHPPRVDPGVYVGTTVGLVLPGDSLVRLAMTPQLGPYARFADRSASGWGGAGTVALVPAARTGVQVDLYLEAPARHRGWAHGAGVIAAGNYLVPYVQAGQQDSAGSGWYVTQGYAWRGYQDASVLIDAPGDQVRPRYWSSTLTGRRVRRGEAAELYLSASLGHFDYVRSGGDPAARRSRLWSIAAGLNLESNLRTLFDRYPPRGPYPGRRRPPRTPPPVPLP